MPRFLCSAALAALLAVPVLAQTPVQVRMDAATFRYTAEQALVEVYLSFGATTLRFADGPDGPTAQMPTRVQLLPVAQAAPGGASVAPVYDQTIPFSYVVADTSMLMDGQVFVEQVRLAATPGEYALDVTLMPPGGPEVRLSRDLRIPDYEADGTVLSTIQLAADLQQASDPADPLAKSGLSIRPNPDAYYGGPASAVRYYAEVYAPPAAADQYTVLTYLAESAEGAAIAGTETRQQRAVRPVDVLAGGVDVRALPSGIYYLRIVALDEANQAAAEQTKRFYVINPDVEAAGLAIGALTYEEQLYAAMGEEELAENVRHARLLANVREAQQIAALESDDDRRRFLAAFWSNRDTDGLPMANQARRTFYERLRFVDQRFSEFGKEPYQTDRGRVYLVYGPPTEIERRVFEADAYPHEIWRYDNIPGEGRSVFVFVDRYSADQYDLLHSDVAGEVSLPSWELEVIR